MTATVYLVEDHQVVRDIIAEYLARDPELRVCGQAASAEQALADLEALRPDVLVVDLSLPGMSGLDLVRAVTARYPEAACLVLTGHAEPMYREQAREAGSRGYVRKDDPAELPLAIRAVLAGQRYESPFDS